MNPIIPLFEKFHCNDCHYTLTANAKNIKISQKYGGVFCPKCGEIIVKNKWKEGKQL